LLKTIIVKALKKIILYFTKNIVAKTNIRLDIRYPALTGYGIRPDICYPAFGLAGYPAKTVSGASLIVI
jgi:hypothetical protein